MAKSWAELTPQERDALVIQHVHGITVYESWEQAHRANEDEFKGNPYAVCCEDGVTVFDAGPVHRVVSPTTNFNDAMTAATEVCSMAPAAHMRKLELHAFPAEKDGRVACIFADHNISKGETAGEWTGYGATIPEAIGAGALAVLGIPID